MQPRLAQKPFPITIHGIEVSRVSSILRENGYHCSVLACLKGGSGEDHLFDFVGRRDGERLAMMGFDRSDYDTSSIDMVKLRVKTLDSNPTMTIVFVQPGEKSLRRFAEEYGYFVLENDDSLHENLDSLLKSI